MGRASNNCTRAHIRGRTSRGYWAATSVGGGTFFLPWLAWLVGWAYSASGRGGEFPGEWMTKESYATISRNQPPVKFTAERWFRGRCIGSRERGLLVLTGMPSQCSQNVDVNGPHHGSYQLMASSSLHCHRLVEWGRHNELEASMVGADYVHVLRTLFQASS